MSSRSLQRSLELDEVFSSDNEQQAISQRSREMLAPLQSRRAGGDFGPLVNVAKSSRLTKETLEDSDSVNVASR